MGDSPRRRAAGWEPAQALIVALDTERAKVRLLREVLTRIEGGCSFPEDDLQRAIVKVAREALTATQEEGGVNTCLDQPTP